MLACGFTEAEAARLLSQANYFRLMNTLMELVTRDLCEVDVVDDDVAFYGLDGAERRV